jgi:hypothetical protein
MASGNGHNGRSGYHLDTEMAYGGGATRPPWPDAKRGQQMPPLRLV